MATKRYNFKFHCLKDKDIIDRIDSQENKQNYIRELVLSDILADIFKDRIILDEPESESDRIYTFNEWMEKNCKAFNNPDEKCDGCPWSVKYLDDDNQIKIQCNAATAYDEYVEDWKHGKLQQS